MDLDDIDWQLLELLQGNARMTYTELAKRVSLSAPAVTERVRRLEDRGVLTGYVATVDHTKLGLPIEAIVRVRVRSLDGPRFRSTILALAQVLTADHVTGDECWILRVVCTSTAELEEFVERAQRYGETTTSLVFSTPLRGRAITPSTCGGV